MLPWFQISHWPPQSHRALHCTHAPKNPAWAPPEKSSPSSGSLGLGSHLYCCRILEAKMWKHKRGKELAESWQWACPKDTCQSNSPSLAQHSCPSTHRLSSCAADASYSLCLRTLGSQGSQGLWPDNPALCLWTSATGIQTPWMGTIPATPCHWQRRKRTFGDYKRVKGISKKKSLLEVLQSRDEQAANSTPTVTNFHILQQDHLKRT